MDDAGMRMMEGVKKKLLKLKDVDVRLGNFHTYDGPADELYGPGEGGGGDQEDDEDDYEDGGGGNEVEKRKQTGGRLNYVFQVQLFGVTEQGKSVCIRLTGFKPFFYVMVSPTWTETKMREFLRHLANQMDKWGRTLLIDECELIARRKLYGYDNGTKHQFIYLVFSSMTGMAKARQCWYMYESVDAVPSSSSFATTTTTTRAKNVKKMDQNQNQKRKGEKNGDEEEEEEEEEQDEVVVPQKTEKRLRVDGYRYRGESLRMYEGAMLPPLLRLFHITKISPSGWVRVHRSGPLGALVKTIRSTQFKTHCDLEFVAPFCSAEGPDGCAACPVESLPGKETIAPYLMMGWDIECDSSHGDFPVPVKTYQRLAAQLVDLCKSTPHVTPLQLRKWIHIAFFGSYSSSSSASSFSADHVTDGNNENTDDEKEDEQMEGGPDRVYPKIPATRRQIDSFIDQLLSPDAPLKLPKEEEEDSSSSNGMSIERYFTQLSLNPEQRRHYTAAKKKTKTEMEEDGDDDGDGDEDEDGDGEKEDGEEEEEEGDTENEEEENEKEEGDGDGEKEGETKEGRRLWREVEFREHGGGGRGGGRGGGERGEKGNGKGGKRGGGQRVPVEQLLLSVGETMSRDAKVMMLTRLFAVVGFPPLEGDHVTMIGAVLYRYGSAGMTYESYCLVVGDCEEVENACIRCVRTERELLLAWRDFVVEKDPDVMVAYNSDCFDYEFCFQRAKELGCAEEFLKIGRNKEEVCGKMNFQTQEVDLERMTVVLASGETNTSYINMAGRLSIDMLPWMRRTRALDSYTLDNVASVILSDKISAAEWIKKTARTHDNPHPWYVKLYTTNVMGLQERNFVHVVDGTKSFGEKKWEVWELNRDANWFVIGIEREEEWNLFRQYWKLAEEEEEKEEEDVTKKSKSMLQGWKWSMAKDDITHEDIQRFTQEGPRGRAKIAKYCMQDCALVMHLVRKIDVLTDLMEHARLCSVPMHYVVYRGQGIVLASYVGKKCREWGVLLPDLPRRNTGEGYDGATVLEPKTGVHLTPVPVGDFNSLYPSSMISENLCPSSKVRTWWYDLDRNLIREEGNPEYDNLPGHEYVDKEFPTYVYRKKTPTAKTATKVLAGYKRCRFEQTKAVIPAVLEELLGERKKVKKQIPKEKDMFMKAMLDMRQNALKVRANSVYGLLGAPASYFYEPDVASATTANGRMQLMFAKRIIEECFRERYMVVELRGGRTQEIVCRASYVYGDTDSVFFKADCYHIQWVESDDSSSTRRYVIKEMMEGREMLEISMVLAERICGVVSMCLKRPHKFEFEKVLYPFGLLAKKRYFGIKYTDVESLEKGGVRSEMGVVNRRRDNAPIVKEVYGTVMNIILYEMNMRKAVEYTQEMIRRLVKGEILVEKLVITKSLRGYYKDPDKIAHDVLARRIGVRDPGNRPKAGDRMAFVYVVPPEDAWERARERLKQKQEKRVREGKPKGGAGKATVLQGDRIETLSYVRERGLEIDYGFYVTNQLRKPLLQLFALVLEDMWRMQSKTVKVKMFEQKCVQRLRMAGLDANGLEVNEPRYWGELQEQMRKTKKTKEALQKLARNTVKKWRETEAEEILFQPYFQEMREQEARKKGSILTYFQNANTNNNSSSSSSISANVRPREEENNPSSSSSSQPPKKRIKIGK